MRRAVVIYIENRRPLMLQFGCLYMSYKKIKPVDTDLVVFGPQEIHGLIPADCIKVKCLPLEEPPEFRTYRYINSIACLTGPEADFLDQYDYILRTDADIFLTPAWNHYYPGEYTVGRGLYVNNEEVRLNIKRVAQRLGLRHQGIHNTGSTHYGKPQLIREVCRLGLAVNHYLLAREFKDDPGAWPGWFAGVSILYSMEMAVNHLILNPFSDHVHLDFDSTSTDSVHNHAHIHCWHVQTPFSKFHFEHGKYDHIQPEELNPEIIRDYCLYNALLSKQCLPDLG